MGDHLPVHPLDGITVLELPGLATAYCGKLLATLGAMVTKLEPPSGDPTRTYLTSAERGVVGSGAAFWYNNLGKAGGTVDLANPEGRERFARLLDHADVLLTEYQPAELSRQGLDCDALRASHPRLIVTAVTPFGLTGPFRNYVASDLTVLASGGQLFLTGYPDRRPLRYGGFQGYKQGVDPRGLRHAARRD